MLQAAAAAAFAFNTRKLRGSNSTRLDGISNCCCCPVLGMQQAESRQRTIRNSNFRVRQLQQLLCCNQPMQKSPTSKRRWQICKSRCSMRGGVGRVSRLGAGPGQAFFGAAIDNKTTMLLLLLLLRLLLLLLLREMPP